MVNELIVDAPQQQLANAERGEGVSGRATLPLGLMKCTELTMLEIDGTEVSPGELPGDLLAFLKEKDVVDLSDGDSD